MPDDAFAIGDAERSRVGQAGDRPHQHGIPVVRVSGRTAQPLACRCDLHQRGIERGYRLLHVRAQNVDQIGRAPFGLGPGRAIALPGLEGLDGEKGKRERHRGDDDPPLHPVVRYVRRHFGGGRARFVHEG